MGVIEIVKQQERALGKLEGLLEGKQIGFTEKEQIVVSNLLKDGSFSDEQIANIAAVTISYVQQLEQDLKNSEK